MCNIHIENKKPSTIILNDVVKGDKVHAKCYKK